MEPMAQRVDDADYQVMQQFITDSPWVPKELMNNAIRVMKEDASSSKGIHGCRWIRASLSPSNQRC
jgi:hypothetical protein